MYKNITDDLSKTWCLGLQVPRGESPGRLNLTGDGNLIVVTKGDVAYFGTNLPSAARRLVIQNDGTFALYNSNNEQDWSCRKLANSCLFMEIVTHAIKTQTVTIAVTALV